MRVLIATFVSIRGQTETRPGPARFAGAAVVALRATVGILGHDGNAERLFTMRPDVTSAGPAGPPAWTRGVSRLAVLTGAGISTDSGIPDFRGPQGVWTRNPAAEKMSTYQAYMGNPALRRRSWQARLAHPAWAAQPNAAHEALARLARSRIDTQVITQNIDGLHLRAGTPAERVVELHGTMFDVVCTGCGDRSAMADALDRVRAGEDDPRCAQCAGILKSATVMFGQPLEPAVYRRAAIAAASCDLLLAIGSTLTVEPAASLCTIGARAGAALVIVNRDRTPYDAVAAAVIREPIGTAVPQIAGQLLNDMPNNSSMT